jgi:LPXTG-motif cell wall-anchored protein
MKKLQLFSFLYLAIIFIVGGVVVSYFLSQRGDLDFKTGVTSAVFGTLVGLIIAVITSLIYKKKNGNIPPIDERSLSIIKNYFLIVLYILLIGSGIALFTLFVVGVTTIETGALIVCLSAVYILVIIGAFVVKHFC